MVIYYHPGLFRVNAIFNSPGTKKLDTLHSNNIKIQVPAVTTSDPKKPAPVVTATLEKEPVPTVAASDENKLVPAVTATESKEPVQDVTVSESKKNEVHKIKAPEPVIKPITEPIRDFGNILKTMNRLTSRRMAIKVALNLWNIEPAIKPDLEIINDDQDFFRRVSKENNLLLRRITGNLNAISKLNLPVILTVHLNKSIPPVYFTLIKIDTQTVTLRGGKQDISIELSPVELESYWSGEAYVPWKNFLSLTGTIPIDCPKDSITTLKMLLRDIGFKEVEISPFYDDKTRQAVKEIQKKYGLYIDGTVGSTTKIALYNEKKVFKQPHIVSATNSFVR
jgi:hypothetical protein